jgi:hypothetical protein
MEVRKDDFFSLEVRQNFTESALNFTKLFDDVFGF